MAVPAWRAYRRAARLLAELTAYANEQAIELERLAMQLNDHGFALERTMDALAPKLEMIGAFVEQPLVGAALPWLLRRILGRPYRRR